MKMVTALVAVAVFVFAIILMCRQSGVVKEYDFGAGAYYYADIPGFEKIINDDIFVSSVPLWVHIVLFLRPKLSAILHRRGSSVLTFSGVAWPLLRTVH